MIQTNKDKIVQMAVMAQVNHPSTRRGYRLSYDGKPFIGHGMSGLKYNVTVGDSTHGIAEGEHVEPGLSMTNPNQGESTALGVLACIGNKVTAATGDAKDAQGYITGKHGAFIAWFPPDDHQKMTPGDKMRIKAWGTGLQIKGYEETVKVNKIDPELLEKMGITIKDRKLVVPVTKEYPPWIMGSGYGMWPVTIDYDIQTTCPEANEELNLKDIRFGDIVALKDQLNWWGRGYYQGATTIGIVIHGWSNEAGHGPGVTTILSAKPGVIQPKTDPQANITKYLGIT
jgi:hypothetical protein